jgi:hypothetical protein
MADIIDLPCRKGFIFEDEWRIFSIDFDTILSNNGVRGGDLSREFNGLVERSGIRSTRRIQLKLKVSDLNTGSDEFTITFLIIAFKKEGLGATGD